MLPARQRVIAAAQEDASGGGAAAARVPSLCVSTLPGLRPRPARARRLRPLSPSPLLPPPRGPLGRRAPPAGAPTLRKSQTPLSPASVSPERPPCFPWPVHFNLNRCPTHAVVFTEPSPQSLPSELPAVFAISSRLFGDTSRPPNPFLPVIFVIYLGFFSRKLGLVRQRGLHGRFRSRSFFSI